MLEYTWQQEDDLNGFHAKIIYDLVLHIVLALGMRGKRYTWLRHTCSYCGGQYARKWVLKRHLFTQHGEALSGQSEPFTYGKRKSPDSSMFLAMQYLDQKKEERNSRLVETELDTHTTTSTSNNWSEQAMELGSVMRPFVNSMTQGFTDIQDLFRGFIQENFFIPRYEIAGFSGYACEKCLGVDIPLPIKDLGYDVTRKAKHRCGQNQPKSTNRGEQLSRSYDLNVNLLLSYIKVWTGGKNIIVASIIGVSEVGQSLSYHIKEKFDVPLRYYLTEPIELENTPWLKRLLLYGSLQPSDQELFDFCKCCSGTYAIIPVVDSIGTFYYTVSLKPDLRPPT